MGFFKDILSGQAGGSLHPERFFDAYGWDYGKVPVMNDKLIIGSGHGAHFKRKFVVDTPLKTSVTAKMGAVWAADAERKAVLEVLADFEKAYGEALGIEDRAGTSFTGSGNPKQMDCVDEAWNATVVLLWMEQNRLFKFHRVREPLAKFGLTKWNHYAAILEDTTTHVRWAIDTGVRDIGELGTIEDASTWYE